MLKYGTKEWDETYLELIEDREKTEPKPYLLLTPEWISEIKKAIQEDGKYKEVAKIWEGSVALVFKPDPRAGLNSEIFIFMDLWHGECRSAKLVPPKIGRTGDFVLEAEYQEWKGVLRKELNVVKELYSGKVKLVPHDLKKMARLAMFSPAAIRLVELVSSTSVRYPDELPEKEREAFEVLLKELKTQFGI